MARPRKNPDEQSKKGKASWRPATALRAQDLDGFRTRWTNKDPINMQRKEAEGWEIVDANRGLRSEHEHPDDLESGKPLTSVTEYRELVLMALPEEVAQAREEYFTAQTDAQTASLKSNLRNDLAGGKASVHGKIIIE
jgi:hypothetical protein